MNILILYLSFLTSFFGNDNPQLTIHVQNIKSLKGEIIIGVFNTDKDFLKDGVAIKNYTITVDKATETIVIKDLPKGEYAVSLYHDENSDKECNRNFLGIPKEGYGFSNNVKPKFSAPSYEDCKFLLLDNKVLDIVLRH
ncbi:DUF2141 domain-containing protein [Gelidibacter japonicus]|jgi:uncharacterized protein (DUF2141 family)|uniref:DUF2141 domain-containing protein n=1 Tax=Gelidibacter japonicus TaxID=1962232 RepID=UPI002020DF61|nr:DUF2141 domain-containing protein [Gelidibacter japonicus]MCL8007389.1 DUF2141 domain-containing protein [Gelidibacter japonicus]